MYACGSYIDVWSGIKKIDSYICRPYGTILHTLTFGSSLVIVLMYVHWSYINVSGGSPPLVISIEYHVRGKYIPIDGETLYLVLSIDYHSRGKYIEVDG